MGLDGHNLSLFLKFFYFFKHGLFPQANCTNGLVRLWFSIRNGLQDTNLIGTPFVHVFLNLRPIITSFLEHSIFETVVNPIPIILERWMFSIRLIHRTHTPIPRPKTGNWIA